MDGVPHILTRSAHSALGEIDHRSISIPQAYNSENQLVRAVKSGSTGFDMEYWYDALGRGSHSIDHQNGTETFHMYYGDMEITDYAVCRTALVGGVCPASNASTGIPSLQGGVSELPGLMTGFVAQFRIILGQSTDERLAYHNVAGDELSFYLTNHQGSTVAMTDDEGKVLPVASGGRYVYTPYGEDWFKGTAQAASLTGNPYRYTGRRLDAQTGLYYYRARYYDPEQGRFLQTDPIGYEDQMNLYNYVGNDPVNNIDPTGTHAACGNDPICNFTGGVIGVFSAINAAGAQTRGEVRGDPRAVAVRNFIGAAAGGSINFDAESKTVSLTYQGVGNTAATRIKTTITKNICSFDDDGNCK